MQQSIDQIAPELLPPLQQASPAQLRAIALAACRFALERTGLTDPILERALERLRQGRSDDPAVRTAVEALVTRLDHVQWQAQAAHEAGAATRADYHTAFARARAAGAVAAALDPEPFEAATEALYEANFATDDIGRLTELVLSTLGQPA